MLAKRSKMNTKLTLRLNNDVISRMKNYASNRHLSLSKFTETIFRQILDSSKDEKQNLTPIVKKYKGIIKTDIKDEREDVLDYLIKKNS